MATIETPKVPKIAGVDKWEAESAADTLSRAFDIKSDPRLLKAALIVIRKRKKNDNKVLGWAGGM